MGSKSCQEAVALASRMARALLVGLACVALAACQTQVRYMGYAPNDAALAEVQVGRDDREAVAQALGRPGTMGVLSDSGWYYVGSRWEQRGWNAPVEVDREVVAVSFDSRGIVSNVERFGLENGNVVALSRRTTEERLGAYTVIGQIFRNIGTFTADRFFD